MNQIILVITERIVCFCACGNEREMLTNYSNYGQVDYCFAVSTYCKVSKTRKCLVVWCCVCVCVCCECKCTGAGHCALIQLDSFGVCSGSDSTLSSQTVTHFHRVCVCVCFLSYCIRCFIPFPYCIHYFSKKHGYWMKGYSSFSLVWMCVLNFGWIWHNAVLTSWFIWRLILLVWLL